MDELSHNRHDPYKKQRKKAETEIAELDRTDTMLLTRPASDWHLSLRDRKAYSEELFGLLWRVGEVALLFGPRGAGKSILAVQIAESIARGRPLLGTRTLLSATNAKRSKGSRRRGEKVLYVDMQRSEAQWTERYTFASPVPGKLPMRYRFAKNFDRAGIDWTNVDLDAYKRDPVEYALHSIFNKIEESRAKVVIIDDILLGGATALGRKGIARTMQTLKLWAATEGLSILVLAQSNEKIRIQRSASKHSPLSTIHSSLSAMADSVFALAPSTLGPQYRYIKHLASVSSTPADEVLALQLGGVSSPASANSSSCIVHSDLCIRTAPPAPNSLISNINYQIPPAAFMYLGSSPEEQHLIDHAAEALHAQRAEERQLKRLWKRNSKEILVDGMMDGSYMKYLKGE